MAMYRINITTETWLKGGTRKSVNHEHTTFSDESVCELIHALSASPQDWIRAMGEALREALAVEVSIQS